MKLLLFAHVPPPHHGQSYMVELMLNGFGGDHRRRQPAPVNTPHRIECYHVDTRVSKRLEDIGDYRFGKFLLLLWYCLEAIWCRFRYGVQNFYFIPAPGKSSALYRDWVVMLICRPFFKRIILHWHASGLAKWLETVVQMRSRSITYRLMKSADLSIVLSNYGRADAEKLLPARVSVVGNGIPDPCPNFASEVLPRRVARLAARRALLSRQPLEPRMEADAGAEPRVFKVLFLGHCTRDKGLFEAVQGALIAHKKLAAARSPVSLKLFVAGVFVTRNDRAEYDRLCKDASPGVVEYVGFVADEKKQQIFEQADVFCFPTYIESFGLVLVEAMAFGLPIVTTRAGAVPEVMPAGYSGLVDARSSEQVAEALLRSMEEGSFEQLRHHFETHFTLERYFANFARAIHAVEREVPPEMQGQGATPMRADV